MQQLVTNRRRSRRITLSLPAAAHQPIRRSGRIVCRIAILLFGHDEEGTIFTERTHTVMLSVHGAGILSTHRFAPEQELILRIEETSRELPFSSRSLPRVERKAKWIGIPSLKVEVTLDVPVRGPWNREQASRCIFPIKSADPCLTGWRSSRESGR